MWIICFIYCQNRNNSDITSELSIHPTIVESNINQYQGERYTIYQSWRSKRSLKNTKKITRMKTWKEMSGKKEVNEVGGKGTSCIKINVWWLRKGKSSHIQSFTIYGTSPRSYFASLSLILPSVITPLRLSPSWKIRFLLGDPCRNSWL